MTTNIDRLTAQLDDLVRKIDRTLDADLINKRKQTFHLEHDDGNGDGNDGYGDNASVDDTWSEHADSAAPGNNADLDDGDNPDDYMDEAEDEDDGDGVQKFSNTYYENTHSSADRPGSLASSDHPSPQPRRHKFEALVTAIQNDQGIPKSTAMAYARQNHPEVFEDYQRFRNGNGIGKRAPATFEDLVNAEMRKGLNAECAAQRVVQQHGFRALDFRSISKREAVSVVAENELLKRAGALWEDDPALSRTEALRAARQDHPSLYRRMQR
jgi:hypothetical protein